MLLYIVKFIKKKEEDYKIINKLFLDEICNFCLSLSKNIYYKIWIPQRKKFVKDEFRFGEEFAKIEEKYINELYNIYVKNTNSSIIKLTNDLQKNYNFLINEINEIKNKIKKEVKNEK